MNEEMLHALANVIKQAVNDAVNPLQQRIKTLESAPKVVYSGVYEAEKEYQAGEMVTNNGSVWHCNVKTMQKPDGSNTDWTLAVKKGRDSK